MIGHLDIQVVIKIETKDEILNTVKPAHLVVLNIALDELN